IALEQVAVDDRGDLVGPEPLHLAGERMRHRLHVRGVGFFQLADEVEDAAEPVRVDGNLIGRQRKARQRREGFDLAGGKTHCEGAQTSEKTASNDTPSPCGSPPATVKLAPASLPTSRRPRFPNPQCSNACAATSRATFPSTSARPTR